MSSITPQQTKLDLELVPKEKRLDIGKCNGRLNPGKIQREPTFQVVLDALALTLCYSTFLITADVPEVYMHQFWDSVCKHDTFYRFKMDKRKRFKLNLEVFRDIFKILPRVQGQDFDALPTDEEIMSFLRDLGHTGEIYSLNDVVIDQMHQPWRTFSALINRSLYGKTTGLNKLRLSKAQIFWGVYHQKNVDHVELLWEEFIYQIDNKAYKKQVKMYYPRFSKVTVHYLLTQDKTLSWRNKIRMHTSRDDYLINTLRFVSTKEETQIYGAILPDSLTSPEMKETKAYKTYLGFASGATPPKKARKFKKPASPKLTTVPVSTEEPTRKSKRVKRPAKKTNKAPTRGVVIRETPKIPVSKKKEKKSMRDFHKTHLSGSGTVTKIAPSAAKIKTSVTSEGTGVKPGVPDVTEEESSKSEVNDSDDDKTQLDNKNELNFEHETDENESDQDKNKEDEEEVKDKLIKTPSNDSDDENETKFTDKAEGDEEMDYTTSQLYDDLDIRLNELVDSDKGFVQEEGTNAAMTNVQQGNENPEILQGIEDAHVTLFTFPQKTEVLVTSYSHSSYLAEKFLNFSDIPHTDAEIVSPMDVHVHHEVPSQQTPTLLTVHVSVIFDSSPVFSTIIPQSLPSFTSPPQ
ncbi:hypothetical protein Tco_0324672 [Tanacetum coccineum]